MYILPALEKFDNIYFNKEKLYEKKLEYDGIPEGEYNKKVFPYNKVLSDLWEIIFEVNGHIKSIYDGKYVKKGNLIKRLDKKNLLRQKNRDKDEKIREKAYKKGQEMATYKYNWIKMKTLGYEGKKEGKKWTKAYNEGFEKAKEFTQMTDEEILNKAKQIKLEKKLGFRE